MEKIYNVCKIIVNESGLSRVKSRIVSKSARIWTVIAPMLFIAFGLFGVNESAWAYWTTDKDGNALADNASIKGYVSNSGSTYYVLDQSGEQSVFQTGSYTYNMQGPGSQLNFDAKVEYLAVQNLKVTDDVSTLYDGYPGTPKKKLGITYGYDYASYGPYSVNIDSKTIRFYGSTAATLRRYFKNVKVTMGSYFVPEATSIAFGAADINTANVNQTLKIHWSNIAAQAITKTGDADRFLVSATSVPSQAGYYGNTVLTITYKRDVAGSHTMTLTVNGQNITVTGTTNKLQPTITWSSNDDIFNVDDVLSATNTNDLTVTLLGNSTYVTCSGNTATMKAATPGTITITAHVTGSNIYADKDFTKDITITNLEKQTITWNQDFSRLKTTDATKSITLNATASSGLPVTYELSGDKTGLSLSESAGVWTLNYSASECKNTTILAKQAGNATYAPASSVSRTVKVIDPTKVCDENETLVNSTVTLKETSTTYNIDIPNKMYVSVSRTKQEWYDIYIVGVDFEFYSGRNGTGTKLYTKSYGAGDIDKSISNSEIDLSSYINAKSVKVVTTSSNGYNINKITYSHQKYCTISKNSLSYNTYPNTTTSAQTFNVSYANYPIVLECSNDKFSFSPTSFGDCSEYGVPTVSVTYTAGAAGGTDNGYLYVKDNTGKTLQTCTLSVTINKLAQSITTSNIASSYNTTDRIELSAEANSGLTAFTYSATPSGVASFDGNVMTFSQSGTIAITVHQAGDNVYAATSKEYANILVNKVTPAVATLPKGTAIPYLSTLNSSELSGGAAETTLRGVEHSSVAGSFAWTEPTHQVTDNAGAHSYELTFTPTDGGMYTTKKYTIPITITRAAQAIEMNNGAVKVAVDGIDAGKADSYIDLDDLINLQTNDPVEASRAGVVTYEVISENKADATIAAGNIFSATVIGDYTIRATKAQTAYYNEATADFTVTVSKRANTMVLDNNAYEKFVDDVVSNIRSVQNSDGTIHTSSSNENLAYYDIAQDKIFIPNSDEQMFGNYTQLTIKIWQDETDRFLALPEQTITLTVKKYVTALTGNDFIVKVDGTRTADYAYTHTSASVPSSNLTDDFYYTIDEPNFDNEALNNGTKLVTFDPNTNVLTGLNAGTTKITFFQKETRKYTGATLMCNIAVEKRENLITNSWYNNWQREMDENASANVSFSSSHADFANYPILIEQIYGEDVATLTGDAESATITTNTTKGYAIWHISQAENYKYHAAEADLMILVGVPAPPTCYVYQDMNNEHKFSTGIGDAEGHFETPIVINSPIDKIWYSARRQWGGVNYFAVQYSMDNAKTWTTVSSPSLDDEYDNYSASFPAMSEGQKITHVRFGATTGATLSKWYKDVQISRKSYLNIKDAEQKNVSKLPTMTCTIDETSSATAKFYIDYSTCADEIIIESSNPEHFTVNRSTINVSEKHDNLNSAKEEITVTYSSTELGTHSAVITVRTSYQTRALSVSGETTKRTPTLTWQAGFTNTPLTLPVGLVVNAINPAAASTSTALIMYESSDENVIKITENGYAFQIVGLGSATLTAIVPENDKWKSISDSRVIHATEKTVQEIVWDQTFPRFMQPGDVIDLDAKVYLRQLSTNSLTYSAERSSHITYSCPLNNGKVTVNGNKMTVLDYGEVKVWASVGGNANYEAAATVTMLINVRQPSVGCATPLVLNVEDIIDMHEVNIDFSNYFDLKTEEIISDEIAIDHANGKPDKLSFNYAGEEGSVIGIKFFSGAIKFEQRVNSQWVAVENSRVETVKNEWNTNANLQLDENADALRIIREAESKGHHKIKDIQVTRKQYLRTSQLAIDLGEIKKGQAETTTIGFDYSDIKGDLTARTINNTTDLTIKDNGVIDLECGSFGHYDLPVTFTPTQTGDWSGTVEVYDPLTNLSITVALSATVSANEEFIFNQEGDWNEKSNWTTDLVPDGNADITVAKDMIINSAADVKSITIEEGVTVTVKRNVTLQIGNGTPKSRETYGNLYVEDGGQVILAEGATVNVNTFRLEASLGGNGEAATSGQVTNYDQLNVAGDAYFQLSFDPSGSISYGWYDFVLPFDVEVNGGIYLASDLSTPLVNRVDFAIMDFSEEKRAADEKAWYWFSGTLKAGKLYTITLDETRPERNTYVFKKKEGAAVDAPASYVPECSGSDANSGWNGLGNGTLRYCQLNSLPMDAKMQVYDHQNDCYVPREATNYTYAAGTAFFIQVDASQESITLDNVTESRGFLAPAREDRATDEFRLSLTAEGAERADDQMWFSAAEEATEAYVIGHDLTKMGSLTGAKVAQMWATKGNHNLCDIETQLINGSASAPLTVYAPKDGQYMLAVDKTPEDATLYLTYSGMAIWNLTYGPYMFDLKQGLNEGYGLLMHVHNAPEVTTGMDNTGAEAQSARKVLLNDQLYILTPDGSMYNVSGKMIR